MLPNTVLSRCDRLGDLILSLPALGLLRQAGAERRTLHCAPYARDIGDWALSNGLATGLWVAGEPLPAGTIPKDTSFLALQHSAPTASAARAFAWKRSLGPRSKLSTLWTYNRTVRQSRSRVEKSEMAYNLDLVRAFCADQNTTAPAFDPLPALIVPESWRSPEPSPEMVLVVSNRGSAANWPVERYIEVARASRKEVHYLVSGIDAEERAAKLRELEPSARIIRDFPRIRDLIAYLAGAGEVVSSSTGPLHIAHAAGVPVTGIYPRKRVESFDRWRPHGYRHAGWVRYLEID